MKPIITLIILLAVATLTLSAVTGNIDRNQYRPGQYYEDMYSGRRYTNREIYHPRRYYDNFYKKYNPDVESKEAHIIEHNVEPIKEDGSYSYMYETDNGIHNEAHASANTLDNGDTSQKVEGAFSFVTPEGIRVIIRYVADENGYRPIITYDGVNFEQFRRSQAAANVEII